MFQGFLPSSTFPMLDLLSDRGQTPGVNAQRSELPGRNFEQLKVVMISFGLDLYSPNCPPRTDLAAVLPP